MNQLLILYHKVRESVRKVFEPEDRFNKLIYRLEGIDIGFLHDILSYNNAAARVRALKPTSRRLDNYLKWVVTKERTEQIELVVAEKTAESFVYLTDFFSDKGALQDAAADFQVLKQSMIRFIRLYETYALSKSKSFERDYFLRTMLGHLIGLEHLTEDLHGLSTYGTVAVRE